VLSQRTSGGGNSKELDAPSFNSKVDTAARFSETQKSSSLAGSSAILHCPREKRKLWTGIGWGKSGHSKIIVPKRGKVMLRRHESTKKQEILSFLLRSSIKQPVQKEKSAPPAVLKRHIISANTMHNAADSRRC
jgi:hypothetical protein